MSKIIKPVDRELFDSARRFEKKSLATAAKSPRARTKEEKAPVNDSPPAPTAKENPKPEPQTHQPQIHQVNPQDLIADAERKAGKILLEAERKAEQIVREAESKSQQVREQAHAEGRAEGCAQAAEEARRRTDEQLRASRQALDSLVSQIMTGESDLKRLVTPMIANLATELARKIIRREIEKDPSTVVAQAEEAISKILERDKLIIRVNPADEELMKAHKEPLTKMFDGIDKIEVIADPVIERGGCIVETNLIRVDAQPSSQLEAARKALLSEAAK